MGGLPSVRAECQSALPPPPTGSSCLVSRALLEASWVTGQGLGRTSCLVLGTWLSEEEDQDVVSQTRLRRRPCSVSSVFLVATLWLPATRSRAPEDERLAGDQQGYQRAPKPFPDFPVACHSQRVPLHGHIHISTRVAQLRGMGMNT